MSLTLKVNQSLVNTKQIVRSYFEFMVSLDTPISLSVALLIKYEEYDQLVTKSVEPHDYLTADRFRRDYQAVSGLKKAAFIRTSIDKRQVALDKFHESEEICRVTNRKFDFLMYEGGAQALLEDDPEMLRTLERAASLIKRILGPLPSGIEPRFGPGVTSVVKQHVTLPKKYTSKVDVSPLLFGNLPDLIGPTWLSKIEEVTLVDSSQIAFVPKDAKSDRTICIEPHLNGYAQLGVGSLLRSRFRPYVNLNSGQEVNRFLASVAHDWQLATIDLKSASDTISRSLVWYLLPEEWAELLDRTRSHYYTLNGVKAEFEKFSSMGNGFTFELESIIFYALTRACGSSRLTTATYGDDIICDESKFEQVVKTLEFCGFTVNWDKSFCRSPFYESCGQDFFLGALVRPFFWKENKPSTLFKMGNDISRFARLDYGRDARYRRVFDYICGLNRRIPLLPVPDGVGDIGFVVDFDVAQPHVRRLPNGWCGFSIKALKYRSATFDHSRETIGLLSALDNPIRGTLLEPPPDQTSREVPIRGVGMYQIGRITVSQWSGYGPWVN